MALWLSSLNTGLGMPVIGLRILLGYTVMIVVALMPLFSAKADRAAARSLNARVSGDLESFISRMPEFEPRHCSSPPCDQPVKPIYLTLSSPHTGRVRIQLMSQRHVGALPVEDKSNAPLIFRGRVLQAKKDPHSQIHVVAVLYRDTTPYTLEISLLGDHSHKKTPRGLSVTSVRVPNNLQRARRNARIHSAPSHYKGHTTCRFAPNSAPLREPAAHELSPPRGAKGRYNVIYLATDYDPEYAQLVGCSSQKACQNRILGSVAQASLLYEASFGIVLEVARRYGPTRLSATRDPSVLLGKFVDFNNQKRSTVIHDGKNTGEDLVDLFAFFTGKSLEEDVNGLTYLSIACRDEFSEVASLIVEHLSDSLDPVIIAHHVGHTLSASHSTGGVMQATLSDPPPTTFDPQSKVEISGYLGTFYSSCRGGRSDGAMTPTPTPSPTPTPDPYAGVPQTLQLSVSKPTQKTVELSASISTLQPNCIVTIKASGRRKLARQGQVVRQFTPSGLTTTFRANLSAGIDTTTTRNALIHFFAEYRCAGNQVVEMSSTKRLNPNTPKIPKQLIEKAAWIKRLRSILR